MKLDELSTVCFVVYDEGDKTFLTKYHQWSHNFSEAFIYTFPGDAHAAAFQHGRYPFAKVVTCRVNTSATPADYWHPED